MVRKYKADRKSEDKMYEEEAMGATKKQDFNHARAVVKNIENKSLKQEVYEKIALGAIRDRYFRVAGEFAEKIGDKKLADKIYSKAAMEAVRCKAFKSSEELAKKIKNEKLKNDLRKELERKRQPEGGLEKKTMVFLFITIAGIALGIGSLTITGHAVSNLTQTTPGLLGIIFFIVGLTGVFLSSKKK